MPGLMEVAGLLTGSVAALFLLDAIIRRSSVGAVVALIAAAINITFPLPLRLSLGGTQIGPWDVVCALLLSAAVARLLRTRSVSGLQWLLIAFGSVAILSIAQGISEYGVNTALNEFRKYFWFVSASLYFSTIQADPKLLDRIARGWLLLAGFLVVLSFLRWGVQPVGLEGALFGALTPEEDDRVILAGPTLILLQGFLIGALAWARGTAPAWMRRLTPVLLGLVVLMQHRTVWAVGLVTACLMIVLERRLVSKFVPLAVLAVLTMAAFSLTVLHDHGDDLPAQLAESAAYRDTWEWRIEGWHLLIVGGPQGVTEVLTGQPFGGGWDRWLRGGVVSYSPHNFYIETYLRTGLLGLGVLVSMYALAFQRLGLRHDAGGLLGRRALFLLLLTHPVFFIPYTPAPEQGVVFGLAIATASALRTRVGRVALEPPEKLEA